MSVIQYITVSYLCIVPKNLSSTASDIATLTTDFRFGLGTAMDKVINPFTRQDPK